MAKKHYNGFGYVCFLCGHRGNPATGHPKSVANGSSDKWCNGIRPVQLISRLFDPMKLQAAMASRLIK